MDITSPPVLAAIITIFSTFLFTQVIGRIIDHNYDKNYRELERNLQLKKLLGETMENPGLDELIRIQLNSYILIKSSSTAATTRWHRFLLLCIATGGAGSLAATIINFQNHLSAWGVTFLVITFGIGLLYFDRRKIWLHRSYAENTKYRAEFRGGDFDGKHAMVDIKQADGSDNLSTLDHPFVYVEDQSEKKIYVYKRIHSSGNVSVSSGENTNLITEYAYQGLFDQSEGRKALGKNPVVPSTSVRNMESLLANFVAIEEVQVITKPIIGTVSLVAWIAKFIGRGFRRKKSGEPEAAEPPFVESLYTGIQPRIITGTQPSVQPKPTRSVPVTMSMPIVKTAGTMPIVPPPVPPTPQAAPTAAPEREAAATAAAVIPESKNIESADKEKSNV